MHCSKTTSVLSEAPANRMRSSDFDSFSVTPPRTLALAESPSTKARILSSNSSVAVRTSAISELQLVDTNSQSGGSRFSMLICLSCWAMKKDLVWSWWKRKSRLLKNCLRQKIQKQLEIKKNFHLNRVPILLSLTRL